MTNSRSTTAYATAQRLSITSEVLWGLHTQRMMQTDKAGREPYVNLEKAQLEASALINHNLFTCKKKGGEEGEGKQTEQVLPFETRLNMRRWGTPFGNGGRCHSDLFEGLEGAVCALAAGGEMSLANRPKGIVTIFDDSANISSNAVALSRFVLGPFLADCTFASPHRHTPPARPAPLIGDYLGALNTEDEPHYWAAFGDYLASPDAMATIGAAPPALGTPSVASSSPLLSFPIPHPMQIFDVRLANPALSFDSLSTCDVCNRRNLRMMYEARRNKAFPISAASVISATASASDCASSSLPHLRAIAPLLPKPSATASAESLARQPKSELFRFTSDHQESGFDVCVTCAAALASEAHIALLSTVGAVAVVAGAPEVAAAAATSTTNPHGAGEEDDATSASATSVDAETMAPPPPEALVCTNASLGTLVAQSAERDRQRSEQRKPIKEDEGKAVIITRQVTVTAIGARPTIGINNRMRIGATAKLLIYQQQQQQQQQQHSKLQQGQQHRDTSLTAASGGVLTLYVAISPIGARPVARVWAEGYGSLLRDCVLRPQEKAPTITPAKVTQQLAASDFSSYSYTSHPAYTAARRLIAAAAALRPFMANASRVPTRQLRNIRCSTTTTTTKATPTPSSSGRSYACLCAHVYVSGGCASQRQ